MNTSPVSSRVGDKAYMVGSEVAPDGCRPNTLVLHGHTQTDRCCL